METNSFGINPIMGGTLPNIAIEIIIVDVCFLVMCIFILLVIKGINIATITV
jgi:hypothetical protein